MINAQPVYPATLQQLKYLFMYRLKHYRVLDPHGSQLVDIKKAPPVDVVVGGTPACEAIVLLLQQRVQTLLTRYGSRMKAIQALLNRRPISAVRHHKLPAFRRYREAMLVVSNNKVVGGRLVLQRNSAVLQSLPVVLAQEGQQHSAAGSRVRYLPINVEEPRVCTVRTVLQYIAPPRIMTAHHGHVVWYHIHDKSHIVPA